MPSTTVRIGADTRDLDRALTQAGVAFEKFDRVVAGTTGKLRSSLQGFSGEKVITQAHAMADAYRKLADQGIGLTEKEQRKLNAAVVEGIAKYRALGMEAPPQLAKVATETEKVARETGLAGRAAGAFGASLKGAFVGMAGAFAVGNVVSGFVADISAAATEAMSFGGKITDLSLKTGMSKTALQEFGFAAEQTGTSIDTLTDAAFKLQRNIGEGSDKTRKAIKDLGLSFDELRGMRPEEQFRVVADALQGVGNQAEFAEFGMALFGKGFSGIASTVREGFGKLIEDAHRFGVIFTDEMIDAADAAGDLEAVLKAQLRAEVGKHVEDIYTLKRAWQEVKLAVLEYATFGLGALRQALRDTVNAAQGVPTAREPVGDYKKGDSKAGVPENMYVPGNLAGFKGLTGKPTITILPPKPSGPTFEEDGDKLARNAARDAAREREEQERANYERYKRSLLMNPPISTLELRSMLQFAGGSLFGNLTGKQFAGQLFGTGTGLLESSNPLAGRTVQTPGKVEPSPLVETMRQPSFMQLAFGGSAGFGGALSSSILGAIQGGGSVPNAAIGTVGQGIASGLVGKFIKGDFAKTFLGGALGSLLPGIGALAGPLLGGVFDKLFGGEAKRTKQARADWVEQAGGIDAVRRMADYAGVSIDRLLSTKKTATFEAEVKKLERAFAEAQARVQALVTDLGRLGETGGLITKDLLGRVTKDLDKPEVRQAFEGFVRTNLDAAARGMSAFLAAGSKLPLTARGAEALGGALAGIAGRMREMGASMPEVLKALGPAVEQLQKRLDAAGLSGGAAFGQLAEMAALASGPITGPLLEGVDALAQGLVGLANSGLLTGEMFAGLTEQVGATYGALIEQGVGGEAALRALGPSLQKLYELQTQFGYSVDGTTEALIEQAKEQGIVGEHMKDTQTQILDVLKLIAKVLGADLPEAARRAGDEFEKMTGRLRVPSNVRINVEEGSWSEEAPPEAHGGALVLPFGLRRFHSGGLAGDEQLAVLQTGEAVLNRRTVAALGSSVIERLNRFHAGGLAIGTVAPTLGGGGTAEQTTNVYLDGDLLTRVVSRRLPRVLNAHGV